MSWTKDEKIKQSVRTIASNNLYLLKYAFRHTPLFVVTACFYPAFQALVIYIEHTLGIKLLTDAIQYDKPFSVVIYYMIFIISLILISFALGRWYLHSIQPKGLEKLYLKIKEDLYAKAASIDLSCYDNPEYYNEFVLSIGEVQNRTKMTMDYIYNLFTHVTYIVLVAGFFILLDKVGLVFVAVAIISTVAVGLIQNKLRFNLRLELNVKERKRNYINRVFYLADYAKELRMNNISGKLQDDFIAANREMRGIIQQYSGKLLVLNFVQNFLCNNFIINGLYLLYIGFMTLVRGAFSYGSAVALVNSAWRLNNSVQNLAQLISSFQENSLYIGKIKQFIAYEPQITDKEGALPMPAKPGTLELRNVSFAYNPEAGNILNNVSLTIQPGEKIALVGHNGAGKTTLVKLLMRLYDVTDGQILINGVDIRNYRLDEYRESFGSVFQDYQLFAATLGENVAMDLLGEAAVALEDAGTDLLPAGRGEAIIHSLERSGFGERLSDMERGILTPLTREFEEAGTNLSGGEAQKVAIARVFAKSSQYMILDEPSSALDPISEYHTNQTMLDAADQKTVIFISHRLSTTRMADRIYLLEHGSIIEQGTHEELMALGGKYAEMFNMQAEKYRVLTESLEERAV